MNKVNMSNITIIGLDCYARKSIGGKTRTKTVNDFRHTATIAQLRKDLEFPADKEKVLDFYKNNS